MGIDRGSGVGGADGGDRESWVVGGGRMGIDRGSGWEGERVGIDRRGSGVGGGEIGDRQLEWGVKGREWGWTKGGVGWEGECG